MINSFLTRLLPSVEHDGNVQAVTRHDHSAVVRCLGVAAAHMCQVIADRSSKGL